MDESERLIVTRRDVLITGAASAALPVLSAVAAQAQGGNAPAAPKTMHVAFDVNGTRRELELDPRTTLLDALREHLHLTGTKKGCDHGQCGACTVIVDGRRINSCLTPRGHARGRQHHHDRGPGHAGEPASDAGGVREA